MIKTAIVGGGPAGAYCAFCLAENGINATIFDPSHPREKPCGGLVSTLAQKLFPFLRQIPIEHTVINKVNFISPSGHQKYLNLRNSVLGFSRLMFDQYLLDRAVEKGAKLIEEEVVRYTFIWGAPLGDLKSTKGKIQEVCDIYAGVFGYKPEFFLYSLDYRMQFKMIITTHSTELLLKNVMKFRNEIVARFH